MNASAAITTNDFIASFDTMQLHPKILQALKANRLINPTKIQAMAIPEILKGRDLLATAETGSGKTLGFVLPALQKLSTPSPIQGRGPRVLILTPTRELANQIIDVIQKMTANIGIKFGSITGGVPYFKQEQLLKKPFEILVATPGRLMDHMRKGLVDFSRLELFVLDEADRLLDMGFVNDMETIAKALPKHQTLLFSATVEQPIQKISKQFLNNPAFIDLASHKKPHSSISQRIHFVDNHNHKRALLTHVLEEPSLWQAIVFIATKRGADELVDELLEQGINCAALHGDMKQSKRSRTLEKFHRGKFKILIATDVAARGIDIKTLSHVINFDLPRTPEEYIHRIGRTGRCGEKGIAISLVSPKEGHLLSRIEHFTGQKIERQTIPGFEPRLTSRSPSHPPKKGTNNRKRNKPFSNSKPNGSRPAKDESSRKFSERKKKPSSKQPDKKIQSPRNFKESPRKEASRKTRRPQKSNSY